MRPSQNSSTNACVFQPNRAGSTVGRIAADHAVLLQPVDPPLDRRRRQRHARADVLKRAASVLPQERNDLLVNLDPMQRLSSPLYATNYPFDSINNGLIMKKEPDGTSLTTARREQHGRDDDFALRDPAHRQPTRCRCWASTTSRCTSATPHEARYFFTHALGFRETACAGLETGVRDRVLVRASSRDASASSLTGALHQGSEIARHHAEHGDGVKVIALSVPDAEHAYRSAIRHGARGHRASPGRSSDEHGTVRLATIAHLRRDAAHVRRARPTTSARSCPATGVPPTDGATGRGPARRHRPRGRQRRAGAAWTSGSPTTSACSASPR